jgi:hypothetical protein
VSERKRMKVAVCGFGRCGSSMLMQMLAAGGLPAAPGAATVSGEHPSLDDAFAAAVPGTAVKLLDLALAANQGVPVRLDGPWALIWLDRDPRWQAESFRKFVRWTMGVRLTVNDTRVFRESLIRDREPSLDWLRGWGHPLLTVSFDAVLAAPVLEAERVAAFLPWAGLDVQAMASVVHERDARVRPDMSVEEASSQVGASS